jgi:hypothetical protein
MERLQQILYKSRMKMEDKRFLKKRLATYAELKLIPPGTHIIFTYSYDLEDDNSKLLQQLANQCWAYPQELWDEVVETREELLEEQKQFRGLTKAFWTLRGIRETKLLNYYKWLMPEGWEVKRGAIPGDDYERDGFYVIVS